MILIPVGTEKFPFNRLMQWVNQLIEHKILCPIEERIVIQYGSCTIIPEGVDAFSLLPAEEFKSLMQQARLIIAHCGEGTFNTLLDSGRPFILVPRSHRFREHVDNHQVEMASALAERNISVAYSPAELAQFIANPRSPMMPLLREYQIFLRWGARRPKQLRDEQYNAFTKQKMVDRLCLQLSARFTPEAVAQVRRKLTVSKPAGRRVLVGAAR